MLAILYIGSDVNDTPHYEFRSAYEIRSTDQLYDLMDPCPIRPGEFPCAVAYQNNTALASLEHHRRTNAYDWHWYTDVADELMVPDYNRCIYRRFV